MSPYMRLYHKLIDAFSLTQCIVLRYFSGTCITISGSVTFFISVVVHAMLSYIYLPCKGPCVADPLSPNKREVLKTPYIQIWSRCGYISTPH